MGGLKRFLKNVEGASAVEYAVLLALIVAVVFAAVVTVGLETLAAFVSFESQL